MSYENPIILANQGDDNYKFVNRDLISSPIMTKFMRLFLADESMLQQTIQIRSTSSTGKMDIRHISLSTYPMDTDATNLILLIPLTPPLLLDGNTSFRINIPAQSNIRMMFYFDRNNIADILSR
jgi:hypothetical protein